MSFKKHSGNWMQKVSQVSNIIISCGMLQQNKLILNYFATVIADIYQFVEKVNTITGDKTIKVTFFIRPLSHS